ncbi:MAG: helix-hairpin-helix domain-containing protein [Bacillota bacterium]|jgi:competence protein ComEA
MVYVLTALFLLGAASIWWQGVRPSLRLTGITDEDERLNVGENPQALSGDPVEESAGPNGDRHQDAWIWVHVAGCVRNPGVHRLKEGQRVYEALEIAEPLIDADLDALNLASLLRDSDKIYVPSKTETAANPPQTGSPDGRFSSGNSLAVPRFPININTANATELDWLPGIGPALAGAIITYRTEHGPFAKPEDIVNVSGIGEKTYAKFSHLIVVR